MQLSGMIGSSLQCHRQVKLNMQVEETIEKILLELLERKQEGPRGAMPRVEEAREIKFVPSMWFM